MRSGYAVIVLTTSKKRGWALIPISWSAGPSEAGWTVVEVWDSQEALDQVFRERIGPAA